MDTLFLVNILLSFIISGSWIAFSSVLAERIGAKLGGAISNLPSNILVSMIFVAIVNDIEYVTYTVKAVPVGLTGTTIFLLVFVFLLRKGIIKASLIAFVVWFICALIINELELNELLLTIPVYLIFVLLSSLILEKYLRIGKVHSERKKYSVLQIIGRAVFSGSIVAAVVLISKFSPPYFTGIFATFPAMIYSTLYILAKHQGVKFAGATGKVLVLSTTNIMVYVIAVYFTYPRFGLLYGTIISYLASVLWVSLLYPFIKRLA